MRINTALVEPRPRKRTHGGSVAATIAPISELRRSTLTALLWEDLAYEKGGSVAKRVAELVRECAPAEVANLAIECREQMHLRHMPLFLVRELARRKLSGTLVASTLERVIQRPDELAEYLALYWRDGKEPLSAGSKRGLAKAMLKFAPYSLAKYNRPDAIKLRDVLRIVHPKPKHADQAATFGQLLAGTLGSPDTWEVRLSRGDDKRQTFETLLRENKLGGLAFLRNLRNMEQAGVSHELIKARFQGNFDRVLPFRFIAAAKHAPRWEAELDAAMLRALESLEKLPGHTVLVLDVSGSMNSALSSKSEINRLEAAGALAVLLRGVCESVHVYATAGSDYTGEAKTAELPARSGMALMETFHQAASQLGGGGIFLVQCLDAIRANERGPVDRIIVFTDEQDCDQKLNPDQAKPFGQHNYLVNVAAHKNGVGYKKFVHIDGFSERVVDYIAAFERGGE